MLKVTCTHCRKLNILKINMSVGGNISINTNCSHCGWRINYQSKKKEETKPEDKKDNNEK